MISGDKRLWILFLVGFFIMSAGLNTHLAQSTHKATAAKPLFTYPAQLLPVISLGYQNLYSQLLWIEAIAYLGEHLDQSNFPYLAARLQSISTLNPKAEHAYYMAATVLPWGMNNTSLSKPLLEYALRHNPQNWRWPYYRGFNAYWFDQDLKTAEHYLGLAAKKPESPAIIASLALRLQAKSGRLDAALVFLEQLIKEKQDTSIRKQLVTQKKALLTEKILRKVDKWLNLLTHRTNDHRDLDQLKSLGYPVDIQLPDGGYMLINEQHELVSSAAKKRFKIFVPPKRQRNN